MLHRRVDNWAPKSRDKETRMTARGQKPDMKTLHPATQLVHGGTMRSQFGEISEALFLTQAYAYPDMETAEARMKGAAPGYVYSRYSNPTVDMFGPCLYVIEELLPRFGVASTLVDGSDLGQWRAAMRPETKLLFLETPTNPCLEVYDIAAISGIAHENGARL